MSYMLTVAMAFMRGSILAALMTKLPLPQMPIAPMRLAVDEGLRAEEIDRGAEGFGIDVRRHQVARLALALAPERQVDRHA